VIEFALEFDAANHSADAVQRAAYRMSDRASFEVDEREGRIVCRLFVESDDPGDAEHVVSDFRNHVIDQVLRERVRRETEGVRNAIFALAFSNTGLIQPD
jgi:His-Xaa-Ser system protein HxsD